MNLNAAAVHAAEWNVIVFVKVPATSGVLLFVSLVPLSFCCVGRCSSSRTNRKESRGKGKSRQQTHSMRMTREDERLAIARFRWCVVAVAAAVDERQLEEQPGREVGSSTHSSSATHSNSINRSQHSAFGCHHSASTVGERVSVADAAVVPSASLPSAASAATSTHTPLHHCNHTPLSS